MKSAAIKLLKTKPHWVALFILIALTFVFLISRWGIYDHDDKLPEKVTLNIQCDKGLYFKVQQSFVSTIPTSTDNVIKNIYCNVPVSRFYNKEFKPIQNGTLQLRLKKRFRGFCDETFSRIWIQVHPQIEMAEHNHWGFEPRRLDLDFVRFSKNLIRIQDTLHLITSPKMTYLKEGEIDSTYYEHIMSSKINVFSDLAFQNSNQKTITILCPE